MRWPLRYQIMLPFAGAMLAVVLGVSLLDAFLAARRTQHQIEQQLDQVAHTLLESNFPLTDAVLRQTRGLSGAEFLLIDRQGKLWASSLRGVEPASFPPTESENGRLRLGDPIEFSGQRYLHTAIAIGPRPPQTEPTLLHILYPERQLREARWQAAYPPLALGSLLLCVVVVLAIAIAGRLSRPILELRRQMSRLVQGDFQPVPLPQRNDELLDLIGSANALGDQLDEMRRAIKRSERLALLGQLGGGLAHQLRNSVTGARIAVQLHGRHCHEIDQDSLAVALRQLTLTETHLQRFLTAGQDAAPQRTRCDLQQIVAEVIALLAPSCDHRGVSLEHNGDTDVPITTSADADQLRQLLMNLVINSIEASGSGGWVRIEMSQTPAATIIRVLDSGPGPDPSLRDRLFEPFVTGKPEGIGLGLNVVQKIVTAHGGTIRYIGEGPTCFETVLPASVLPAAPDHDSAPNSPQPSNHFARDTPRRATPEAVR